MTAPPKVSLAGWRWPAVVGAIVVAGILTFAVLDTGHDFPTTSVPGAISNPVPYPVTFQESGLATGYNWSVALGGTNHSSNLTTITDYELNGSYHFVVTGPVGYTAGPENGTIDVAGHGVLVSIGFFCYCSAQMTLAVGGSISAYPFASLAAQWFEQNDTSVVISVNQGSSAAGMTAVCAGQLNIGVASVPESETALIDRFGCSSQVLTNAVAYDVVDIVVNASNPHGLLSIESDTLAQIYDRDSTTAPTLVATTEDGVPLPSGYPTGPLDWDNLPAAAAGAVVDGIGQAPASGYAPLGGSGQAAGTGDLINDIVTPSADPSPCGWTICAGPFSAVGNVGPGSPVAAVETFDPSGDTQTFEARLLGATGPSTFASDSSQLGFQGCGNLELLSDCGISVPDGNATSAGALSLVAADPNAIGYAPDGLVRPASGPGLGTFVPFLAIGETVINNASSTADGGVVPTMGPAGSIAAGIDNSTGTDAYAGWIPFVFVEATPPSGVEQHYLDFALDPATNTNLCWVAGGLISIYAV